MKDYSSNLNELYFDATKTFELIVGGHLINSLFLTYFGNNNFGGFNLTCENLELKQKRWKYVSLPMENWKSLYTLIESAKLEELPQTIQELYSFSKKGKSYDIIYDGANYQLKIKTNGKLFELHREMTKENQFIRVVNAMLETCPLINQDLQSHYSCSNIVF